MAGPALRLETAIQPLSFDITTSLASRVARAGGVKSDRLVVISENQRVETFAEGFSPHLSMPRM
jgi:hypothetical protein